MTYEELRHLATFPTRFQPACHYPLSGAIGGRLIAQLIND